MYSDYIAKKAGAKLTDHAKYYLVPILFTESKIIKACKSNSCVPWSIT